MTGPEATGRDAGDAGPRPALPAVTAIVPVYNGRAHLERCLPALLRAGEGASLEILVVDDGSDDGSAEYARSLGARVLSSGGRQLGPGAARNVGAEAARGDLILFVDADVAVHEDVLAHVLEAFREADVVAIFGAYDDAPPHRGFASQYMNLRHHFVHQDPTDDAQTFWTGLGAVRRDAMLAVGGFDGERFPRPSIEDIDLGRRLRAKGGRIRRIPAMRATHLKEWSLPEVVRTDVLRRALPWARLMHEFPGAFTDLNVGVAERLKALVAGVFLLSVVAALFGGVSFWAPLALLLLAAVLNRGLLRVFYETNGAWFALRALLYHQVYYVYSAGVYVFAALERAVRSRRPASETPSG
jgi:GT2 family glycosyltransferase